MSLWDYDNSNLGMELKESQVMHIPFDEHFSPKNTKDGTIIEFRDRNGKSHTARISKWHLRAVRGLDVDYLGVCPVIRAIIVLRKKLGELAFEKYDAAAKVLGELGDKQESSPEWKKANQSFGEALRDILFRSEISCMALPMLILANKGKRFEITSKPWPHRHPPERLIHLGSKGFNGKSRLGILAFDSTSSRDFWIVDQFDNSSDMNRHMPSKDWFKQEFETLLQSLHQEIRVQPSQTASLLQSTIKKRLGTLGMVKEVDFTASPHFKSIAWGEKKYTLRGKAAIIIESLYIIQKYHELPSYHQEELFAQIYGGNKRKWPSSGTRIQNYFRTGDAKRIWDDKFITHDDKGHFWITGKIHTNTQ